MSKKSRARELAIEELKELGDDESLDKLMRMIEKNNVVAVGTWVPGEREKVLYLEGWLSRMKNKFFRLIGRA